MRRILSLRYPDHEFEVVNLAYDGYDSYQLLARLQSDGLRLEPDLIIVNTGINDVRNARFRDIERADPRTVLWRHVLRRLQEEREHGGPSLWSRIKHHSYLARLPGTVLFLTGRDPTTSEAKPEEEVYPDAVDYFAENLRGIAEEAGQGIPIIFSAAPSSFELDYLPPGTARRSYWLATPEATQEYRLRLELRMRDLAEELRAEGYSISTVDHSLARDMFLDDAHLTPTGNRIVAETFVEAAAPYIGSPQAASEPSR
jgi:lysophospholipase L1-like esterase